MMTGFLRNLRIITYIVLDAVDSDSKVQDRGSPPLQFALCNQIGEAEYGETHGYDNVKNIHCI
jgi:hypothetical protein